LLISLPALRACTRAIPAARTLALLLTFHFLLFTFHTLLLTFPARFGYFSGMAPFPWLLLLFLLVPMLEIYLLIVVGGIIGALPTVMLVVLTAVIGAALARHQGLATLQRLQAAMARGEAPAIEILEGVLLLVGALLLLTPGFFTDALGFACLLPPSRRLLSLWLLKRFMVITPAGQQRPPQGAHQPQTLEGEFRREDDADR
jgi:UPF0716 protein FxsA